MFKTTYKFDIMNEGEIDREIEALRRRECYFTVLANDATFYSSKRHEICERILAANTELERLDSNWFNREELLNETRETLKTLHVALGKKQEEEREKQKVAREKAAAKNASEGVVRKGKTAEEKFWDKYNALDDEIKKLHPIEFFKAIMM